MYIHQLVFGVAGCNIVWRSFEAFAVEETKKEDMERRTGNERA